MGESGNRLPYCVSTMERWKTSTRDSRYQVSDQGRVRGPKGRVLRPGRMSDGHLSVMLGRLSCGGQGSVCVHVLVMEEFGPSKPFLTAEVRHLDGNPRHNAWDNLAWGSRGDNNRDKKYHAGAKGRLTVVEVREVKRMLTRNKPGVEIAAWFGVGETAISAIKHGHNHAEVK